MDENTTVKENIIKLKSSTESDTESTTPESTKQTTEESTNSTGETVEVATVEEEIIEHTADPEPASTPHQEVAATTEQPTTDQPTASDPV